MSKRTLNAIPKARFVAGLIAALALTPSLASAQATATWNGTSGATWDTTATNWTGVSGTPWNLNNGTLNTANFTSTSGNATVSGTVFVNTINYTAGSGSFAIESGTVSVGGSAPSISVNASRTLTINITLAGSTDWSKAGAGTLVLAGANTYTGNTTISAGVLNIRHNNALGATGAGNGTTINSGAALQLSNNITIAETISLNSTGIGGSGGINNLSGSNIISGAITSGSANTEGI